MCWENEYAAGFPPVEQESSLSREGGSVLSPE